MIRPLAAVVALSAALCLSSCGYAGLQDLPLPGSPAVGSHPFTVEANFANVADLTRDSTVKLNGVTVGRVAGISRHGWTASVTLTLQAEVAIPSNAQAQIRQTGLLGEPYVALVAPANPAAGRLQNGSTIPTTNTSVDYDVEEVLGALSLLLNGGGLSNLQTITVQLRDALVDDGATKVFLAQLNQFVTTLDQNKALIISTISNVNSLSSQLSTEHNTVSQAIDSITAAAGVLAGQQGQITSLLQHLDGFSQATTRVVLTSGANLVATLHSLQPVLTQLQNAGNQLPEVIGTVLSFPFPDNVLTAVKGNFVNLDVLVDLSPLVLLGNTLPKGASLPSLAMLATLLKLSAPTNTQSPLTWTPTLLSALKLPELTSGGSQ